MKRTLFMLLAVAATLIASAPARAVTFGQPDVNRHPFVGTLVFKTVDGYFSCSGTLLAPVVLLTAGHCTESGGAANLRTWVTFASTISLAGIASYPSPDDYFDDPVNGWISGEAIAHPEFDDYARFPLTFDVGVVLLDEPVAMSTYGQLPPLGLLATVRRAADNRFTVVGYGLQGLIRPFESDVWARYTGEVKLAEVNSRFNGGQSAKFSNNPGIGGGSCFGDSGGPVFYQDTPIVVAVVSFGITPCIGIDFQFRTDTPVAQDFLRVYVD